MHKWIFFGFGPLGHITDLLSKFQFSKVLKNCFAITSRITDQFQRLIQFFIFFRYYLTALLIIPTLFYLPKFFEYDTIQITRTITDVHPCASMTNQSGCIWDPTEQSWVKYSYREFNDTELQFSWLRKNYYYRRVCIHGVWKSQKKSHSIRLQKVT